MGRGEIIRFTCCYKGVVMTFKARRRLFVKRLFRRIRIVIVLKKLNNNINSLIDSPKPKDFQGLEARLIEHRRCNRNWERVYRLNKRWFPGEC